MSIIKKFIRDIKQIKMTSIEKNEIKLVLLSCMKKNPIENARKFRFLFLFFARKPVIIALCAVLLFGFGGGVSYAAEDSVPGEVLYPIKTKVNERLENAIAFGLEAKARANARFAERRLEEMRELSFRRKLDLEKRDMLIQKFEEFEEKARARIQEVEAQGKIEQAENMSAGLESAIDAHAKILEKLNGNVEPIIKRIHARANIAKKDRARMDEIMKNFDESNMFDVVQRRMNDVARHIQFIEKNIKKSGKSKVIDNDVQNNIEKSKEEIRLANEAIKTGNNKQAFEHAGNAKHLIIQSARFGGIRPLR